MHVVFFRIDWPARPLWQNTPCHWRRRAEAIAAQKEQAWALALQQSVRRIETPNLKIKVEFHPPDKRRRDLQNMPATVKGAIDGIALAHGSDDYGYRVIWPSEWGHVVKGGCVSFEVTE